MEDGGCCYEHGEIVTWEGVLVWCLQTVGLEEVGGSPVIRGLRSGKRL